jgi:CHAT domain-containing protein
LKVIFSTYLSWNTFQPKRTFSFQAFSRKPITSVCNSTKYILTLLTPRTKVHPYIPPLVRGARGVKGGTASHRLADGCTGRRKKVKVLFLLLFLFSFVLTQELTWSFGGGILPVFATSPVVTTVVQNSPNPKTLVEQGKALYEQGKFAEAVTVLQQAAAAFKSEGDILRQAMTLSNLSLAYQQLSAWSEAEQAITESLKLLQSKENSGGSSQEARLQVLAQTQDIQGRLQLSLGKPEEALHTWQQAAATYAQIGSKDGITQNQINQAQAMQELGFYPKACKTLLNALGIDNQDCKLSEQQLQTLKKQPDSLTKAIGLRSLGNILQLVGDLKQSEEVLKQSLEVAQRLQSPANISATLFSLGNTIRAQQNRNTDQTQRTLPENALTYYRQAAEASTSPTTKIQAQLNQLSLLLETNKLSDAQILGLQIQTQLFNLPVSRMRVYAQINLAQSLMKLSGVDTNLSPLSRGELREVQEASQLLATAVQQAKSMGDQRAIAYALGNLGELYQQTGQLSDAQDLTNQALLLAQTINAPDIAYRWQWQLGRLLKAKGNREGAIAAYISAWETLKSLRGDLVSINPDVQFSFRENVEPVYRELVDLLLKSPGTQPTENDLKLARDVIESLQQAELINFFRENCLNGNRVQIDKVDPKAVVIYPIVLKERLEVLLALPGGRWRHYSTPLPQNQVEDIFNDLRQIVAPFSVNPSRGIGVVGVERRECENRGLVALGRDCPLPPQEQYLPLAQQVYNWLIRPVEQELAASEVKTLVFVLDSPLLNLPMALLHDGQQFLVEKYAIAYTPGLELLDSQPLARGKFSALKAGLTQARDNFPPLPNVKQELEQIRVQVPGELLLDQNFTSTAIQQEISSVSFPIVHLATHGQFSSNAEETFILTWDNRLKVNQLNTLLRSREERRQGAIELLVLSACQTATGDKRAALGLAGVALRAGARSTLATLWFVDDAATAELMTRFYRELSDTNITKAEALRRAQVAMLKEKPQPFFWAPYVLVGNWL